MALIGPRPLLVQYLPLYSKDWITIMKVLKRADISEEGQATMEAFTSNN